MARLGGQRRHEGREGSLAHGPQTRSYHNYLINGAGVRPGVQDRTEWTMERAVERFLAAGRRGPESMINMLENQRLPSIQINA
jgi:hypothetical protein